MKKTFLDESKPICTCSSESCDNCEAGKVVTCHFNLKLLMKGREYQKKAFHTSLIPFTEQIQQETVRQGDAVLGLVLPTHL
mgnify:CR=1 FL=1